VAYILEHLFVVDYTVSILDSWHTFIGHGGDVFNMSTTLYQYKCDDCGRTVTTKEHPQQNENDPLWCPPCSAVEIDHTVNPDEFDDAEIVHLT